MAPFIDWPNFADILEEIVITCEYFSDIDKLFYLFTVMFTFTSFAAAWFYYKNNYEAEESEASESYREKDGEKLNLLAKNVGLNECAEEKHIVNKQSAQKVNEEKKQKVHGDTADWLNSQQDTGFNTSKTGNEFTQIVSLQDNYLNDSDLTESSDLSKWDYIDKLTPNYEHLLLSSDLVSPQQNCSQEIYPNIQSVKNKSGLISCESEDWWSPDYSSSGSERGTSSYTCSGEQTQRYSPVNKETASPAVFQRDVYDSGSQSGRKGSGYSPVCEFEKNACPLGVNKSCDISADSVFMNLKPQNTYLLESRPDKCIEGDQISRELVRPSELEHELPYPKRSYSASSDGAKPNFTNMQRGVLCPTKNILFCEPLTVTCLDIGEGPLYSKSTVEDSFNCKGNDPTKDCVAFCSLACAVDICHELLCLCSNSDGTACNHSACLSCDKELKDTTTCSHFCFNLKHTPYAVMETEITPVTIKREYNAPNFNFLQGISLETSDSHICSVDSTRSLSVSKKLKEPRHALTSTKEGNTSIQIPVRSETSSVVSVCGSLIKMSNDKSLIKEDTVSPVTMQPKESLLVLDALLELKDLSTCYHSDNVTSSSVEHITSHNKLNGEEILNADRNDKMPAFDWSSITESVHEQHKETKTRYDGCSNQKLHERQWMGQDCEWGTLYCVPLIVIERWSDHSSFGRWTDDPSGHSMSHPKSNLKSDLAFCTLTCAEGINYDLLCLCEPTCPAECYHVNCMTCSKKIDASEARSHFCFKKKIKRSGNDGTEYIVPRKISEPYITSVSLQREVKIPELSFLNDQENEHINDHSASKLNIVKAVTEARSQSQIATKSKQGSSLYTLNSENIEAVEDTNTVENAALKPSKFVTEAFVTPVLVQCNEQMPSLDVLFQIKFMPLYSNDVYTSFDGKGCTDHEIREEKRLNDGSKDHTTTKMTYKRMHSTDRQRSPLFEETINKETFQGLQDSVNEAEILYGQDNSSGVINFCEIESDVVALKSKQSSQVNRLQSTNLRLNSKSSEVLNTEKDGDVNKTTDFVVVREHVNSVPVGRKIERPCSHEEQVWERDNLVKEPSLCQVDSNLQGEYCESEEIYGPFNVKLLCKMGQVACTSMSSESSFVPFNLLEEVDVTIVHSHDFAVVDFTNNSSERNDDLGLVSSKSGSVLTSLTTPEDRVFKSQRRSNVPWAYGDVDSVDGNEKENYEHLYDVAKTKITYDECNGHFVKAEISEKNRQRFPTGIFNNEGTVNDISVFAYQHPSVGYDEKVERISITNVNQDTKESLENKSIPQDKFVIDTIRETQNENILLSSSTPGDEFESSTSSELTDVSGVGTDSWFSQGDLSYVSEEPLIPRTNKLSKKVAERLKELAQRYRDQEKYGLDGRKSVVSDSNCDDNLGSVNQDGIGDIAKDVYKSENVCIRGNSGSKIELRYTNDETSIVEKEDKNLAQPTYCSLSTANEIEGGHKPDEECLVGKNFDLENFAPDSEDLSQRNLNIEGEILLVQDTEFELSIGGDFSEKVESDFEEKQHFNLEPCDAEHVTLDYSLKRSDLTKHGGNLIGNNETSQNEDYLRPLPVCFDGDAESCPDDGLRSNVDEEIISSEIVKNGHSGVNYDVELEEEVSSEEVQYFSASDIFEEGSETEEWHFAYESPVLKEKKLRCYQDILKRQNQKVHRLSYDSLAKSLDESGFRLDKEPNYTSPLTGESGYLSADLKEEVFKYDHFRADARELSTEIVFAEYNDWITPKLIESPLEVKLCTALTVCNKSPTRAVSVNKSDFPPKVTSVNIEGDNQKKETHDFDSERIALTKEDDLKESVESRESVVQNPEAEIIVHDRSRPNSLSLLREKKTNVSNLIELLEGKKASRSSIKRPRTTGHSVELPVTNVIPRDLRVGIRNGLTGENSSSLCGAPETNGGEIGEIRLNISEAELATGLGFSLGVPLTQLDAIETERYFNETLIQTESCLIQENREREGVVTPRRFNEVDRAVQTAATCEPGVSYRTGHRRSTSLPWIIFTNKSSEMACFGHNIRHKQLADEEYVEAAGSLRRAKSGRLIRRRVISKLLCIGSKVPMTDKQALVEQTNVDDTATQTDDSFLLACNSFREDLAYAHSKNYSSDTLEQNHVIENKLAEIQTVRGQIISRNFDVCKEESLLEDEPSSPRLLGDVFEGSIPGSEADIAYLIKDTREDYSESENGDSASVRHYLSSTNGTMERRKGGSFGSIPVQADVFSSPTHSRSLDPSVADIKLHSDITQRLDSSKKLEERSLETGQSTRDNGSPLNRTATGKETGTLEGMRADYWSRVNLLANSSVKNLSQKHNASTFSAETQIDTAAVRSVNLPQEVTSKEVVEEVSLASPGDVQAEAIAEPQSTRLENIISTDPSENTSPSMDKRAWKINADRVLMQDKGSLKPRPAVSLKPEEKTVVKRRELNSRESKHHIGTSNNVINFWKNMENSNVTERSGVCQLPSRTNVLKRKDMLESKGKDTGWLDGSDLKGQQNIVVSHKTGQGGNAIDKGRGITHNKDDSVKEDKKKSTSKLSSGLHLSKQIGNKVSKIFRRETSPSSKGNKEKKKDKDKGKISNNAASAKSCTTGPAHECGEMLYIECSDSETMACHVTMKEQLGNKAFVLNVESGHLDGTLTNSYETHAPEVRVSPGVNELTLSKPEYFPSVYDDVNGRDMDGIQKRMESTVNNDDDFIDEDDGQEDLDHNVSEETVYQDEKPGSESLFYVLGSFRKKGRRLQLLNRSHSTRDRGLLYRTTYNEQRGARSLPSSPRLPNSAQNTPKKLERNSSGRDRSRTPLLYRRLTSSEDLTADRSADDNKYGFTVALVRSRSGSVNSSYSGSSQRFQTVDDQSSVTSSGFWGNWETSIDDFHEESADSISSKDKPSSPLGVLETDLDSVLKNTNDTKKTLDVINSHNMDSLASPMSRTPSGSRPSSSTLSVSDDDSSCSGDSFRRRSLKTITVRKWPENANKKRKRTRRSSKSRNANGAVSTQVPDPRSHTYVNAADLRWPKNTQRIPSPAIGVSGSAVYSKLGSRPPVNAAPKLVFESDDVKSSESDLSDRTTTPVAEIVSDTGNVTAEFVASDNSDHNYKSPKESSRELKGPSLSTSSPGNGLHDASKTLPEHKDVSLDISNTGVALPHDDELTITSQKEWSPLRTSSPTLPLVHSKVDGIDDSSSKVSRNQDEHDPTEKVNDMENVCMPAQTKVRPAPLRLSFHEETIKTQISATLMNSSSEAKTPPTNSFRPITSRSTEQVGGFRSVPDLRSKNHVGNLPSDDTETEGILSDDTGLFSDTSFFDAVGLFDDNSFTVRTIDRMQFSSKSPRATRFSSRFSREEPDESVCANPVCRNVTGGRFLASSTCSSCIACFTYYCSNECRRADWGEHKRVCYYGRVHFYVKALIRRIEEVPELLHYLSQLAVDNFHCRGQGAVQIHFSSPMALKLFLIERTHVFPNSPIFSSRAELKQDKEHQDVKFQVLQCVNEYQPELEFVVNVTVSVENHRQSGPYPGSRFKSNIVRRCLRIPLHPEFLSLEECYSPSSYDIKTFSLPNLKRHDFVNDIEARRHYCAEISRNLRRYGVYLKRDYPQEYQALCLYVERNESFDPLTLYGTVDGKTFKCIVLPEGYNKAKKVVETSETGVMI